jgi:hypothetical protein
VVVLSAIIVHDISTSMTCAIAEQGSKYWRGVRDHAVPLGGHVETLSALR